MLLYGRLDKAYRIRLSFSLSLSLYIYISVFHCFACDLATAGFSLKCFIANMELKSKNVEEQNVLHASSCKLIRSC